MRAPSGTRIRVVVACFTVLATAASPRAQPDDCRAEAAALRARLQEDARRAHRWNLGWGVAFGATTVGSLALAVGQVNPFGTFDDEFRDTQYVGAAKSAIGLVGHLVVPLRVDVPSTISEPCADRDALRLALADGARRERSAFWLGHIGTIAVNVAGAVVLAERHSWQAGVASALVGYPIGVISVYTAPRSAWHEWQAQGTSWTLHASATPAGGSLWLIGEF